MWIRPLEGGGGLAPQNSLLGLQVRCGACPAPDQGEGEAASSEEGEVSAHLSTFSPAATLPQRGRALWRVWGRTWTSGSQCEKWLLGAEGRAGQLLVPRGWRTLISSPGRPHRIEAVSAGLCRRTGA